MIFSAITAFVQKYRIVIIILWIAGAAALFLGAPKFSDVAVTDESQFLPQNTQSAAALKLLQEKFATAAETPPGSGIIVIYDANGLTNGDLQEAKTIRDWLVSGAGPQVIEGVISIYDNDLLRQKLISTDQTTMLMEVNFSVSPLSDEATAAGEQIKEYLSSAHANVNAYFTGETGLLQDLFQSVQKTISKATIVTVILVLFILLIIYRSPVAALLPLVTIGCSFLASMGILSFIGQAGVKFFTLTEAYLVVIIFGIGTDYCLFIVSRFREELKKSEPKTALNNSLRHIGPVITASGLTVIVAFLCLSLSRFGMNKTSGYALALGIAVSLLAGLTLIPALMSLFGKFLFWPGWTVRVFSGGKFSWAKVGEWVVRHPLLVALPIIIVLLIPYIAFSRFTETNDILSQMPSNTSSVQGFKVMNDHFPPGELSPVYLLIESRGKDLTSPDSLQSIKGVAQSLQNLQGISQVDYFSAPSSQLAEMAVNSRAIGDDLGQGSIARLSTLQTYGPALQGLALQYPGIVQSQNFLQIEGNLTAIKKLTDEMATADAASLPALLSQLRNLTYNLADNLDALVGEFNLQGNTPFIAYLLKTYFSTDETTARINVTLTTSPYAEDTVKTIVRLRQAASNSIDASGLKGSAYYVGGESAVRADILLVSDSDFGIVVGSSIAGVLIVIIILLRSLLASLYMVATVLLNYGATLGIIAWVITGILKQTGMIYMLPIFIFIILVALGADYNIFLVSRIREEAHQRPLKEAVSRAVANTGGVITSCGIILAGTFATLTTTPLQMVMQIGVAIIIGVLIDTFIVRALLVPSIAVLAGKWSWWPSGLFRRTASRPPDTDSLP